MAAWMAVGEPCEVRAAKYYPEAYKGWHTETNGETYMLGNEEAVQAMHVALIGYLYFHRN